MAAGTYDDVQIETKYANRWAYAYMGRSILKKHDKKYYWFAKWYRQTSPHIHYPDHVLKKLPVIPEQELFMRQLKEPENVIIR